MKKKNSKKESGSCPEAWLLYMWALRQKEKPGIKKIKLKIQSMLQEAQFKMEFPQEAVALLLRLLKILNKNREWILDRKQGWMAKISDTELYLSHCPSLSN